jgi:nicotinate-nucleotide--dimethylbenzimidazole phosphoribosyltransferase
MTDTGQIPGEGLPENAGGQQPEGQQGVPASGSYASADPAHLDASPGHHNEPHEEEDLLLMPSAQGAWNEQPATQGPGQQTPQPYPDPQSQQQHQQHQPEAPYGYEYDPHAQPQPAVMADQQLPQNGQLAPQSQYMPEAGQVPADGYGDGYGVNGYVQHGYGQQEAAYGEAAAYGHNPQTEAPQLPAEAQQAHVPGQLPDDTQSGHSGDSGQSAQNPQSVPDLPNDGQHPQDASQASQPTDPHTQQDVQPDVLPDAQPDVRQEPSQPSGAETAAGTHEPETHNLGPADSGPAATPQQPQAASASAQGAPGQGASSQGTRRPLHLGPPVPEQSGTVRPLSERPAAQQAAAGPKAAPVQNAPGGSAVGGAPQPAAVPQDGGLPAEQAQPSPAQATAPAAVDPQSAASTAVDAAAQTEPEPESQPQPESMSQPEPEPQQPVVEQPAQAAADTVTSEPATASEPEPDPALTSEHASATDPAQPEPAPAVEEPLPGPQLGQLPPIQQDTEVAQSTPAAPADEQAPPTADPAAATAPTAQESAPEDGQADGEAASQAAHVPGQEAHVNDTVPGPRQEAPPGGLPTVPAQGGESQPQAGTDPEDSEHAESPENPEITVIPGQATAPDSSATAVPETPASEEPVATSAEEPPAQETATLALGPTVMETPEPTEPDAAAEAPAAAPEGSVPSEARPEGGDTDEATPAPDEPEASAAEPSETELTDKGEDAERTGTERPEEPEASEQSAGEAVVDGTDPVTVILTPDQLQAHAQSGSRPPEGASSEAPTEATEPEATEAAEEPAAEPADEGTDSTAPTAQPPDAEPAGGEAAAEPAGGEAAAEPAAEPAADPADGEAATEPAADPADGEAATEPAADSPTEPAPGFAEVEREAVHRLMRERRDIRNGFRPDPVPHEVLLRVLEAAHTAPSVGHSQPWDFVVIRSEETRRTMHELVERQRQEYAKSLPKGRAKQFKEMKIEAILDTPVNIVVTADPTRGGRHTLGRHTQPQMAPYSSALAVENLWLAARAEGLGVGWVSFFDERELVRTLELPDHLEVVAYLCVGYVDEFPDEPELMRAGWSKRRPLSWVVHEESYGRRALPGAEPAGMLAETLGAIRPLDAKALGEAWERQKRMTKPAGALGMLEIISAQLCGLSRKCPPPVPEPAAVAIFAGDHGVHAQGVTPWPQEVTAQMVTNFLGGGAVCNAFANQVGAEVCVVDVGVAAELPATPGLLPRKVRPGTDDMTAGPALSREDVERALEVGIETARDLVSAGNKALLTGEMGIANTTASAALIAACTGADPGEVTGRGTGINDETHARKVEVVRRALELHQPDPAADPLGMLAAFGGLEHAAMVGLILGGASLRTPVVLDGVSAGAAALVARAVAPEALAACIAGHRSAEPGHVAALTKLGLRPLVDLDLRLGEGTGALLALPVVQSAARALREVATFDSAGVTDKN